MKKLLILLILNIGLFAGHYGSKKLDIKVHEIGYFSLNKNSFFQKYIEIYCINGVRYFIVYGGKYAGISPMYNQKGDIMTCTIRKGD